MHRHSPRIGFFEALFFTSAVLVASSRYIQHSCIFFTYDELIVYLFRLPFKIIFFHSRFYVIFCHSLLLKRRKKVCRQIFLIMGDAKIKSLKSRWLAPLKVRLRLSLEDFPTLCLLGYIKLLLEQSSSGWKVHTSASRLFLTTLVEY